MQAQSKETLKDPTKESSIDLLQEQATIKRKSEAAAQLMRKIEAIGSMEKGKHNLITDVKGVRVGHYTVKDGAFQTGLTVILPTIDNIYLNKCIGGAEVINGFGKSAGLVQLNELGQLESPIALANTLNVGKVCDALVGSTIEACREEGYEVMTFNPIVAECNDSYLNTIQTRLMGEDELRSAIASADEVFDQGAVGAGRGMSCHGLKGGIGSSSRMISIGNEDYTLGVLVQANHGKLEDLMVAGEALGKRLAPKVETLLSKQEDRDQNMMAEAKTLKKQAFEDAIEQGEMGSIIVIMATDLPINALQLKRILKRATVGISRVGGYIHHGSGEIAIGFTTANRIPHQGDDAYLSGRFISDQWIDDAFRAMAEATEEAILKALYHAETVVGRASHCRIGLLDILAELSHG